jgi:hypothetical protein
MLYQVHLTMSEIQTHNLVVIGTDYTGSCKSNNHTITTKMAPYYDVKIEYNPTKNQF